MKHFSVLTFSIWLLTRAALAWPEPLIAAFEPLPPHVEANGGGLLSSLLEQIRASSNDAIRIQTMPYSRAKRELQNGRVDLIGFTPFEGEVEAFHNFALEVRWPYPVATDFIALTPDRLTHSDQLRVGIPYGNESFAVNILGIAKDRFYLAELDQLVLMLLRGRLDLVWFERNALHQALLKYPDRPDIYYRQHPLKPLSIGIAVPKTAQGALLKQQLEQGISMNGVPALSDRDRRLSRLPLQGVLPSKQPRRSSSLLKCVSDAAGTRKNDKKSAVHLQ